MANFDTTQSKINLAGSAYQALNSLQQVYGMCKTAQALINNYGTDPAFAAMCNVLYTQAEIVELSAMLTDINSLIINWETNHKNALRIA